MLSSFRASVLSGSVSASGLRGFPRGLLGAAPVATPHVHAYGASEAPDGHSACEYVRGSLRRHALLSGRLFPGKVSSVVSLSSVKRTYSTSVSVSTSVLKSMATSSRGYASGRGGTYESAFRHREDGEFETTEFPEFPNARGGGSLNAPGEGDATNRTFAYLMVGASGISAAVGAKAVVGDVLAALAPPDEVLAAGILEVDIGSIPLGKTVILKWRGKPVFVRHRPADEIAACEAEDISQLRDPQRDSDRVQKPEWLIMLGICTHLGCVPIGDAGDYEGWFCPCHGSHYDKSGRIRKGPAPLNLEIPPYKFTSDTSIVIG